VHSRKHLLKSARTAEIEIRVFQKRPLLRADLSCHPLATFKAKGAVSKISRYRFLGHRFFRASARRFVRFLISARL
jgi:hypothetical protein